MSRSSLKVVPMRGKSLTSKIFWIHINYMSMSCSDSAVVPGEETEGRFLTYLPYLPYLPYYSSKDSFNRNESGNDSWQY